MGPNIRPCRITVVIMGSLDWWSKDVGHSGDEISSVSKCVLKRNMALQGLVPLQCITTRKCTFRQCLEM